MIMIFILCFYEVNINKLDLISALNNPQRVEMLQTIFNQPINDTI